MRRSRIQKKILVELYSVEFGMIGRVDSLKSLAGRVEVSLSALSRSFKKLEGEGLVVWVDYSVSDEHIKYLRLTPKGENEAQKHAQKIFAMLPSKYVIKGFINKFGQSRYGKTFEF
jgi:DNA-binding MarR family transcriptional regulator